MRGVTDVTRFFHLNACAKHGVPLVDSTPAEVTVNYNQTASAPTQPAEPSPPPAANKPAVSLAKIAATAIAAGAAGMGGTLGVANWLSAERVEAPIVVEQVEQIEKPGSLLQYLEDEGYHLPQ